MLSLPLVTELFFPYGLKKGFVISHEPNQSDKMKITTLQTLIRSRKVLDKKTVNFSPGILLLNTIIKRVKIKHADEQKHFPVNKNLVAQCRAVFTGL